MARERNTAGTSPTRPVSGKDNRTTRPTEDNRRPQPRPIQPDPPDDRGKK